MLDRNSCSSIEIVVRTNDVDPYRIAHHANYAVWAETALRNLLKEHCGAVPDYEITRFECKYKASALLDDKLTVRLWFRNRDRDDVYAFRFDVRSDGGRELTVGEMSAKIAL